MKKISFFDRYCMGIFFETALKKDLAAHLLFFNTKPACNICIAIKYPDKRFKDVLALRGWYAFKENEYLFPHPNYIFVAHYYGDSEAYRLLRIDLINKAPFKSSLIKNEHLFREILGSDFTPDKFMSKLEEGQPLFTLLHGDHMLLGILYGYGAESSKAFKTMTGNLTRETPPPQTETYCRIDLKTPSGCKMNPVVFMGNPNSEEVKQLGSIYEEELEESWDRYKNSKNRLNMALDSLCS